MSSQFQIIVADPPWDFNDLLKMSDVARGSKSNYLTMSMSDIQHLPINKYADPNGAILALWVPSSLLQEGLNVLSAWGFTHKQTYVWVKTKINPFVHITKEFFNNIKKILDKNSALSPRAIICIKNALCKTYSLDNILSFGMGRLFRQTHEICLIGVNNNKIYKKLNNRSQRSVSFAENLKHSAKPECLQNSLELMFPDSNKLELFARRIKPNWVCLGNEVCNGEDITVSLAKL